LICVVGQAYLHKYHTLFCFCSRDETSAWNAPRQIRIQFSTRDGSVFDN
jgi:hypothetical protein